jgi:branched-chain amino acid transport system substrate-binding protein
MKRILAITLGLVLAVGASLAGPGTAQAQKEIVIGIQCDRTGATQTVGVYICPGAHDYIKLVNFRGGVEGHKIKAIEIDHEYKVPPAMEAYERHKKEGAVSIFLYGTPQTQALTAKLTEDRIPGTSPGFGTAAAADGTKYPFIFPIAATYWSQGAAAVKFAKDQLGGSLKGKKIAFIYFDNPAGREPLPVLEDLAQVEGFQLKTFAVPPPGIEMGAQVLDIAQRFRADFVIAHLFGRSPSVSIKELKRAGYPLRKVVSFVWGSAEADIEAAGGWAVAEGYNTMQFAGVELPCPQRDPRDVQKGRQGAAQGDGLDGVLQPRRAHRRAPCGGHPECAQGQAGRQYHRRRRQGRLREDQGVYHGRVGSPARDLGHRPRGRRLGPDLPGQGGQVREADGLVQVLS